MLTVDPDQVSRLRDMAGRGVPPSRMLRELLTRLNPEEPRNAILALYMMHAFDLEVYQVSAVFGWNATGFGPLSDVQLDEFLGRHLPAKAGPIK